jgi:hypothetical protein
VAVRFHDPNLKRRRLLWNTVGSTADSKVV